MTIAAIVDLEEIRKQKQNRQSREQLHEQFDNWLNHLEEAVSKEKPSLVELTKTVLNMREELTQTATSHLIERKYAALLEQENATCPHCGANLKARRPLARTVRTLAGDIELKRPYFYC